MGLVEPLSPEQRQGTQISGAQADLVKLLATELERRGTQMLLADLSWSYRFHSDLTMTTQFQKQLCAYAHTLGWPAVLIAVAQAWPSDARYPTTEVLA